MAGYQGTQAIGKKNMELSGLHPSKHKNMRMEEKTYHLKIRYCTISYIISILSKNGNFLVANVNLGGG